MTRFSKTIATLCFKGTAFLCLILSGWMIWDYPLMPALMAVGFLAYGCLLWKYPTAWLFVVPALLPVFDLAPWTGRFFFDEFDVLILVTVTVRYWKWNDEAPSLQFSKMLQVTLIFFVLTACASALVGLAPFPSIDSNSFANYFSKYNSLRVLKGILSAAFLLPILKRDLADPHASRRLFIPGMLVGLSGAGIATLWERQVFSGLMNFDDDFRVVATFSGMHTGGAYIDAYLAAALPFVAGCFLFWRRKLVWGWGLGLFGVGLYALLVTFSRIDYLAFLVSFLVLAAGLVASFSFGKRVVVTVLVVSVIGVAIAGPIMSGKYIQGRFQTIARDYNGRLSHWREALRLMDPDPLTGLLGMGLGSYPRIYAKGSTENEKPSNYWYKKEWNNIYLSLPSGGYLYFDQRVSLQPDTEYMLRMALRSNQDKARIVSPVCEKSLLHSFDCEWIVQYVGATGKWVRVEKRFNSRDVGKGNPLFNRRPVSLSLLNDVRGTILDIDNIQLLDEAGNNLIKNGDFSDGNDFWFFTSDNHLPWHIKNLWVHLLFEHGWLGVLSLNMVLFFSLLGLLRRSFSGDLVALVLLSSLSGLLTVGLVDSLFDFPRVTLLFFLILSIGNLGRPLVARHINVR